MDPLSVVEPPLFYRRSYPFDPCGVSGIRSDIEQAAYNRCDGVATRAGRGLQHLAGVAGETLRGGVFGKLIDQSGFTDARFTAQIKNMASAVLNTVGQCSIELAQFAIAAD